MREKLGALGASYHQRATRHLVVRRARRRRPAAEPDLERPPGDGSEKHLGANGVGANLSRRRDGGAPGADGRETRRPVDATRSRAVVFLGERVVRGGLVERGRGRIAPLAKRSRLPPPPQHAVGERDGGSADASARDVPLPLAGKDAQRFLAPRLAHRREQRARLVARQLRVQHGSAAAPRVRLHRAAPPREGRAPQPPKVPPGRRLRAPLREQRRGRHSRGDPPRAEATRRARGVRERERAVLKR